MSVYGDLVHVLYSFLGGLIAFMEDSDSFTEMNILVRKICKLSNGSHY